MAVASSLRNLVANRARHLCEYCKSPESYAMQSFECEHIVPISKGGADDLNNLAWSCGGCNRFKSNHTEGIDPETEEMTHLFHPRKDDWFDHFVWSDDFCHAYGLTSTGRATLKLLRLNRDGIVRLRTLLVQNGEHPPVETRL